jgi:hypothetical protein
MTESQIPRAPSGLATRGRALWAEVQQTYELNAVEETVLTELCKAVDVADRIRAELDKSPLVVTGSVKQQRVSPLVGALQTQQGLVDRLAGTLMVAMPGGWGRGHQTKAVRSRWTKADRPTISVVGGAG